VENCGGADLDCDGNVNPTVQDSDGDGFNVCGGPSGKPADCCDNVLCAGNPNKVNPAAFDVPNNGVDEDCSGSDSTSLTTCDSGLPSNSANLAEYARAVDLCKTTTENNWDWGYISGAFTLTNNSGSPNAVQRSIRTGFGTGLPPQQGSSIAILSTGAAADQTDTNPNYSDFQTGLAINSTAPFPAQWYAANGNALPNAPGCPAPAGASARDSVMMRFRVRAPTNAQSFSVRMNFYSSEYPEWVCSEFNDFFVTIVTDPDDTYPGIAGNPADGNIARYVSGNNTFAVGVNILRAASGLFTQCTNGATNQCAAGTNTNYNGCTSTTQLAGTGFQIVENAEGCFNGPTGGATGWLNLQGNVEPGEIFEVRFAIWDTSDSLYDSLVVLDDWRWGTTTVTPGVTPAG